MIASLMSVCPSSLSTSGLPVRQLVGEQSRERFLCFWTQCATCEVRQGEDDEEQYYVTQVKSKTESPDLNVKHYGVFLFIKKWSLSV